MPGKMSLTNLRKPTNLSYLRKLKSGSSERSSEELTIMKSARKFHPVFETLKRVAVIVLAVMSISFVSALSIEAVRSDIYNAVIQWFDKKLGISFDDVPTDAPDRILDYKEPVLPEGYERFEIGKRRIGILG